MKRIFSPQILIVGTAALALLGWSTVSAASGSFAGRHHAVQPASLHAESSVESPEASPSAEPEAQNQPAEPTEAPAQAAPEEQNEAPEAEDENENPAPPAAAPTVMSRTFELVGGTVTFTCTGSTISLDSAVPASGFSVETETEDGGQQIKVRFESDTHRSEVEATCVAGQVQATEIREESD